MSFLRYEVNGNSLKIINTLTPVELLDYDHLNVINTGIINGLLPMSIVQNAGVISLECTISGLFPLAQIFSAPLSRSIFIDILEKTISIVEKCENNSFNPDLLDLSPEKMFINTLTGELFCIYWPIANGYSENPPKRFFVNYTSMLIPDNNEDISYFTSYQSLLQKCSGNINTFEIKAWIESLYGMPNEETPPNEEITTYEEPVEQEAFVQENAFGQEVDVNLNNEFSEPSFDERTICNLPFEEEPQCNVENDECTICGFCNEEEVQYNNDNDERTVFGVPNEENLIPEEEKIEATTVCSNCGNVIKNNYLFCVYCGNKIMRDNCVENETVIESVEEQFELPEVEDEHTIFSMAFTSENMVIPEEMPKTEIEEEHTIYGGFAFEPKEIVEEPIYNEAPIYNDEPVYNEAPIYNDEPVYNEAPIYNDEPVYNEAPIYNDEPVYNEAPVYSDEPLAPIDSDSLCPEVEDEHTIFSMTFTSEDLAVSEEKNAHEVDDEHTVYGGNFIEEFADSQTNENVIICGNCGYENGANDSFCINCGEKISDSVVAVEETENIDMENVESFDDEHTVYGEDLVDTTDEECTVYGEELVGLEPSAQEFTIIEDPIPETEIKEVDKLDSMFCYCSECGAKNSIDFSFCTSCGSRLVQESTDNDIDEIIDESSLDDSVIDEYSANCDFDEENTILGEEADKDEINEEIIVEENDDDSSKTVVLPHLLKHKPKLCLFRLREGERIEITKPIFRVGKERKSCDYTVVENPAISRIHIDIISRDGKYYVIDLGTTNGTYIDGKMLPPECEVEVVPNVRLTLADEDFVLYIDKQENAK